MANYVWNKVICDKYTLDTYFIDYEPIEQGRVLDKSYITFNKMFGVKSLNEYYDKIGKHIYYGDGFSYKQVASDRYEIKFTTSWKYPIEAIKKIIELSNNTEWYAVEENYIYVSRFYWCDGVKESVMLIEDGYGEWINIYEDSLVDIEDSDNGVWRYLEEVKTQFIDWDSNDGFERYKEPVVDVYKLFNDEMR